MHLIQDGPRRNADASSPKGGDRAVALYRTYGPAVYRRCLRLLRDGEAAQDATQEVFMKLLRDLGKLEDPTRALHWIYRVTTHHCLNLLRSARRRGQAAGPEALEVVPAPAVPFPERRLARQVLERFDVETQAVALGVLVDGMEHEELAQALGVSRKTVQRRLNRFLEQAKEMLAEERP
ncbi:MAG: sigma-70 family RNA polymerase sigma factor [Anaeromyxobacter sp.]